MLHSLVIDDCAEVNGLLSALHSKILHTSHTLSRRTGMRCVVTRARMVASPFYVSLPL